MTTWEKASAKLGGKYPASTKAIVKEVFEAAQKAGHDVWYLWGMGSSDEHKTGLAADFMVRDEEGGDFVRDYLWAHRKRLRLRHVIWEQHITSTVTQPGVRRKMPDRGSVTKNHYDHVHMFVFAGKYQALEHPKPVTQPGQLEVDGELGPKTIARWQHLMQTPVDGVITQPRSELVRRVQWRLKNTVDHEMGISKKLDLRTIGALQRYLKAPITHKMDKNTVGALQRRLNTGTF